MMGSRFGGWAAAPWLFIAVAALLAGCVGGEDLGEPPKVVYKVNFDSGKDCANDGVCTSSDPALAWTFDSSTSSSGQSARSAAIADNQSSCVWVDLSIPGISSVVVEFKYRISSEVDFDFLVLYLDGTAVSAGSGEVSWASYRQEATSRGIHEWRWCYEKDAETSAGVDAAWVDDIVFY